MVTCTSTGQVCSPAKSLRINAPRRGRVTSVRYTTSGAHCSTIVLQVVRRGQVLATSGRVEPGETSERFNPGISVRKGRSRLGFRAKGFTGGCNSGRLGSWGGKITVTVKLAPLQR